MRFLVCVAAVATLLVPAATAQAQPKVSHKPTFTLTQAQLVKLDRKIAKGGSFVYRGPAGGALKVGKKYRVPKGIHLISRQAVMRPPKLGSESLARTAVDGGNFIHQTQGCAALWWISVNVSNYYAAAGGGWSEAYGNVCPGDDRILGTLDDVSFGNLGLFYHFDSVGPGSIIPVQIYGYIAGPNDDSWTIEMLVVSQFGAGGPHYFGKGFGAAGYGLILLESGSNSPLAVLFGLIVPLGLMRLRRRKKTTCSPQPQPRSQPPTSQPPTCDWEFSRRNSIRKLIPVLAVAAVVAVPATASAGGPVPPKEVAKEMRKEHQRFVRYCQTAAGQRAAICQLTAKAAGHPACEGLRCGWEFGRRNSVRLVRAAGAGSAALFCGLWGVVGTPVGGVTCGAVFAAVVAYIGDVGRIWLGGQCLRVMVGIGVPPVVARRNPCG